MSNNNLVELKHKIIQLVGEYQQQKQKEKESSVFVPGTSVVRYAGRVYGPEELQAATEATLDFWLTAGRFTEEFEQRLSELFDDRDAFMVNSGSSANLIALTTLTSHKLGERRLMPGDEVITVAAGFPTTVAPIVQNQLVPVFIDVDLGGYNAIPAQVAQAIGPKTKAIFLAHTLGNPWDIDAICAIAKENNLWVIEDTCDAFGSEYNGKLVGTYGDIATLSFYPAHHITTGEGGAVVCGTEELGRIARSYRDWGRDCYCVGGENNTCGKRFSDQQYGSLPPGYDHKYVYSHIGYNLKATEFQAAIGCVQLDRLEGFGEARRANHKKLYDGLKPYDGKLILPRATEKSNPSWFAFVITVADNAGFTRNEMVQFLDRKRIETRNLFSGNLLKHPGFENIENRIVGDLSNAEKITNDTFFLGVYPGMTSPEIDYMIESIGEFVSSK